MTIASVVGTTTWGTTLGILAARQGMIVRLWARTDEEASKLQSERHNQRFLPNVKFPPNMTVTSQNEDAFVNSELVVIAVPSRTFRTNIQRVRDFLPKSVAIVSATKGLELGSGSRMSQILEEELPETMSPQICVLSGPNLAKEIISGKISSTVVASANGQVAKLVQDYLSSPKFRVYTNPDTTGVELGGALKNIIALGAGICDGIQAGNNAKAAFITRGLAEISRLAIALGAKPTTMTGLASLGDLIATCASNLSRNYQVGMKIAEGQSIESIQAHSRNTAEGIDTVAAAFKIAEELNLNLPIINATHDILFAGIPIEKAISDLMGRPPRPE